MMMIMKRKASTKLKFFEWMKMSGTTVCICYSLSVNLHIKLKNKHKE